MSNSIALLCTLPEELCAETMSWGQENIGDDLLSGINNKGREKSPHITLATGIIDEEPEQALNILGKVSEFEVELGGLTKFEKPDKGYDVIKIDIISPELMKINSDILQNLEVKDPIIPYRPHITVAYVKPGACDHLLNNECFLGKKALVRSVIYSDRSKGSNIINLKPKSAGADPKPFKNKYTLEEVEAYIADRNISIRTMSAIDICKIVMVLGAKDIKR